MSDDGAVMTGAELKAWRVRSGLTQGGAAERFGVKQATISLWEAGKRPVSAEVCAAIVGHGGAVILPTTDAVTKGDAAVEEVAESKPVEPAPFGSAPDEIAIERDMWRVRALSAEGELHHRAKAVGAAPKVGRGRKGPGGEPVTVEDLPIGNVRGPYQKAVAKKGPGLVDPMDLLDGDL